MSTSLKKLMEADAQRPVPPAPIDEVLAGGRSRLRRRRLVTVAAAAVVAVLAIAIPVALAGGDRSVDEPIERPESDALSFTRPDGSTFTIDGAQVRCPSPEQSDSPSQAIVVLARGRSAHGTPGYFTIQALVDEVAEGATVDLPTQAVEREGGGPDYESVHLFVYDAERDGELSSSQEEASGTIVFESLSCDPVPAIDVRINATLGSEVFEGDPVRVKGRITLGYDE